MAGVTEFAKELTTSDNIAARTLYGGSGADMIAASQKMIFDWVPDLDFADLGRIAGDADQAIDEPVGIFCALPVIR